jgi:hypothetical protein
MNRKIFSLVLIAWILVSCRLPGLSAQPTILPEPRIATAAPSNPAPVWTIAPIRKSTPAKTASPVGSPAGDAAPVILGTDADMFPPEWLETPVNIHAEDLPTSERARALDLMRAAMRRYPAAVLTANLARVYVVGSLHYTGVDAAGTSSLDTVYVADGGAAAGYTDEFIQVIFHHEFSTILLRNYPQYFDETAWKAANPPKFSYGTGGVDAIKNGESSEAQGKEFYKEGFVNRYARSSLEEDFNEIAQNLFLAGSGFWDAVDTYPALHKKVDLAVKFYHSLDERFTEEGFRGGVKK